MRYGLRTLLIVLAVGPPVVWLVVVLALCVWVLVTGGSLGLRIGHAMLNL